MKLRRVDLKKECGLTSVSLVIDEDIQDKANGNIVATILYTKGGHIVYLHREGYDIYELLVIGERFVGETLSALKVKVFKVEKPILISPLSDSAYSEASERGSA